MLLLAHRGASADRPENTLPAFAEAVRQGADGVELDAMVCGSGEVVVCHDERLGRLAAVDWEVARTDYARLQTLDIGRQLGFESAGIPLLEEVLAAVPAPLTINVELKCETADDRGLSEKVVGLVRRLGFEERVLISSFNPLCLARVASLAPSLRRGLLIDPDRPYRCSTLFTTLRLSNYSVHPHFSQVTGARMAAWRRAGLKVAVWTVDEPAEAKRLRALGVDCCITNRPAALRAGLGGSSAG